MKKILFIILAISVFATTSANKKATNEAEAKMEMNVVTKSLTGVVIDKNTNESLAGAVITVNGQKVYSDLDGNFNVNNLCEGICDVKVSLISYVDVVMSIDTRKQNVMEIKLSQR